jgi:hypothetical protein
MFFISCGVRAGGAALSAAGGRFAHPVMISAEARTMPIIRALRKTVFIVFLLNKFNY